MAHDDDTKRDRSKRMPALFLAHGAPPLLDDQRWVAELHAWAASFERPRAILMLRDEGVLIIGSGFLTHNLRALDLRGGPPQQWAVEFDQWAANAIANRDADALLDFMNKAPAARIALPTREHFVPLLVAAGAATEEEPIDFPITGFWMGSMTRRSVQFG